MPNQQYQDPIMKKYADLILARNAGIKYVYYGDPILIPMINLPCLVISKSQTQVENLTNAEDVHSIRLNFTIVTDIRDTLSEDKAMVAGVNALYNLMEGREDDYTLKTTSLLYILRHNVELDPGNQLRTDLRTMTSIDYGMTLGKRSAEAWSVEGSLTLTAHYTQVR